MKLQRDPNSVNGSRRRTESIGLPGQTPEPYDRLFPKVPLDVTILLPCRDEQLTVGRCVTQGLDWLAKRELTGEVLVVDNASKDDSAAQAFNAGAQIIHEAKPGYGRALRAGITAASGRILIMADADGTYDLRNLDRFYDPINSDPNCHMIIGNRFASYPTPEAMSRTHLAGNIALSRLTRAATGTRIRDVHCGLRSFTQVAVADLPGWSSGMEFATHMLVHAEQLGLGIGETPVRLWPGALGRQSHLRPIPDGLRHLAAIAVGYLSRVGHLQKVNDTEAR